MPFPSPPWDLRGCMWLSVFVLRSGSPGRPAGLYGAAFVDYRDGGVLSYRELLVSRVVLDGAVPRVNITDIWVDSPASRDGGRSLWAIPKELADLHVTDRSSGVLVHASCDAGISGSSVAAARFTAGRVPSVRTPVAFTVAQDPLDAPAGPRVVTPVSGSSRNGVVRGRWDFGDDGPLAWLQGHRPVLSLRLDDFRLRFGA